MEFSKKLQEQRAKHKLSQVQLADRLHIARQSISKWERNEAYPSIGMLLKLSELFDISVDELLKGDAQLQNTIVKDGEKVNHPYLKLFFDWMFITGVVLLIIKLAIIVATKLGWADWNPAFLGGWLYSLIPLILMLAGGIGSDTLKGATKQ